MNRETGTIPVFIVKVKKGTQLLMPSGTQGQEVLALGEDSKEETTVVNCVPCPCYMFKKKKKQVVLQPVLWMRKLRLREQKTLTKVTQSGTGRVRLNVGLPQKGKEVGDELRECH